MPRSGIAPHLPAVPSARCRSLPPGIRPQADDPAAYITTGTAKTHVARLLAKLDARDRVQLVITAYETGLVSAPH